MQLLKVHKSEADEESVIDHLHHGVVQVRDFVRQTLFIQRAQLFQQYDRVPFEAIRLSRDLDVSWQFRLLNLGRDSRHDDGGTKAIPDVVLNDENGAKAALFRTDYG